jgi:hypothetical protein
MSSSNWLTLEDAVTLLRDKTARVGVGYIETTEHSDSAIIHHGTTFSNSKIRKALVSLGYEPPPLSKVDFTPRPGEHPTVAVNRLRRIKAPVA